MAAQDTYEPTAVEEHTLSDAGSTSDSDSDSDYEEEEPAKAGPVKADTVVKVIVPHIDTRSLPYEARTGTAAGATGHIKHAMSALGEVQAINVVKRTYTDRHTGREWYYLRAFADIVWSTRPELQSALAQLNVENGFMKLGGLGESGENFWKVMKYVPTEKTTPFVKVPRSTQGRPKYTAGAKGGSRVSEHIVGKLQNQVAQFKKNNGQLKGSLAECRRQLKETSAKLAQAMEKLRAAGLVEKEDDAAAGIDLNIFEKLEKGDDGVPKPTSYAAKAKRGAKRTGNKRVSAPAPETSE